MRGPAALPRTGHPRGVHGRAARARRTIPRRGTGTGGRPLLGQPRARRRDHRLRGVTVVLFAFHALEYLGLLGGLGSFVVRRLGRMPPRIGWADPPMHIAFATALAGGLGLLALPPGWLVLPRLAAQALAPVFCLHCRPLVAPFSVLAPRL